MLPYLIGTYGVGPLLFIPGGPAGTSCSPPAPTPLNNKFESFVIGRETLRADDVVPSAPAGPLLTYPT